MPMSAELESSGRRTTRQRQQVYEALGLAPGFVTAQQLHQQMLAQGATVGLATVYRSLQLLAADGGVDVVRTQDGETAYRRCSPTHHHHLICRSCGRTIEIEAAPLEQWAEQIAAQYGFCDIGHVVEIDGLCPDCSDSSGDA